MCEFWSYGFYFFIRFTVIAINLHSYSVKANGICEDDAIESSGIRIGEVCDESDDAQDDYDPGCAFSVTRVDSDENYQIIPSGDTICESLGLGPCVRIFSAIGVSGGCEKSDYRFTFISCQYSPSISYSALVECTPLIPTTMKSMLSTINTRVETMAATTVQIATKKESSALLFSNEAGTVANNIVCQDTPDWTDEFGYNCAEYIDNIWCSNGRVVDSRYAGYGAEENCCECNETDVVTSVKPIITSLKILPQVNTTVLTSYEEFESVSTTAESTNDRIISTPLLTSHEEFESVSTVTVSTSNRAVSTPISTNSRDAVSTPLLRGTTIVAVPSTSIVTSTIATKATNSLAASVPAHTSSDVTAVSNSSMASIIASSRLLPPPITAVLTTYKEGESISTATASISSGMVPRPLDNDSNGSTFKVTETLPQASTTALATGEEVKSVSSVPEFMSGSAVTMAISTYSNSTAAATIGLNVDGIKVASFSSTFPDRLTTLNDASPSESSMSSIAGDAAEVPITFDNSEEPQILIVLVSIIVVCVIVIAITVVLYVYRQRIFFRCLKEKKGTTRTTTSDVEKLSIGTGIEMQNISNSKSSKESLKRSYVTSTSLKEKLKLALPHIDR